MCTHTQHHCLMQCLTTPCLTFTWASSQQVQKQGVFLVHTGNRKQSSSMLPLSGINGEKSTPHHPVTTATPISNTAGNKMTFLPITSLPVFQGQYLSPQAPREQIRKSIVNTHLCTFYMEKGIIMERNQIRN